MSDPTAGSAPAESADAVQPARRRGRRPGVKNRARRARPSYVLWRAAEGAVEVLEATVDAQRALLLLANDPGLRVTIVESGAPVPGGTGAD